jgi:sugar phosphate isomerase/epimerase
VFINIEYEPGTFGPGGLFVGSASTALAMCRDVGWRHLGINLDLIHSAVCGEDIPATIRLIDSYDRLNVIEFDDMQSARDEHGILRRKHEHLIPGDGELAAQYPAIFEALEEIGYNGPIIVELYNHFDKNPEEACRRSFEYLMTNFGKYFD